MKKSFEKYSFPIQVTTLGSLILFAVGSTLAYSQTQNDLKTGINGNTQRITSLEQDNSVAKNGNFSARLAVVEAKQITQQNYLYDFKSDIKSDVKNLSDQMNQVIKILLKN